MLAISSRVSVTSEHPSADVIPEKKKSRLAIILIDIDRLIDFYLARWIVWRGMRRDIKREQEVTTLEVETKC